MWRIPEWLPPRLQKNFPELTIVHQQNYANLDSEIGDAEIYAGFILPPASLALARNLRWIHATAAGVDQLCYPEMVASPVVLTNSSTVMADPVAEHTSALMLALAKRIPSSVRYQLRNHWAQVEVPMETPTIVELQGATLGLVGLGTIGQALVMRARAFGMRVVAVKRDTSTGQEWADRVLPPSGLHEMLKEADFVVVTAPQTAATRNLFGAAEFAAMKRTAYFINVARGSLVDESALAKALHERQIGGAACDVFEPEPPLPDSPLWTAPGMLITPHMAGTTEKLWTRQVELLEDNISRYLSGRALRNIVDKSSGY